MVKESANNEAIASFESKNPFIPNIRFKAMENLITTTINRIAKKEIPFFEIRILSIERMDLLKQLLNRPILLVRSILEIAVPF